MVDFYAAQIIFLLERMFLCLLCNKEALTSPTPHRIAQEDIEVCLLADPERLSNPVKKTQAEVMFLNAAAIAAVIPAGRLARRSRHTGTLRAPFSPAVWRVSLPRPLRSAGVL